MQQRGDRAGADLRATPTLADADLFEESTGAWICRNRNCVHRALCRRSVSDNAYPPMRPSRSGRSYTELCDLLTTSHSFNSPSPAGPQSALTLTGRQAPETEPARKRSSRRVDAGVQDAVS